MASSRWRLPFSWRPLLRSLHRDLGYLAVGLTLVYALSGLAVNHISDWDPNFRNYSHDVNLGGPLRGEDNDVAARVARQLGVEGTPTDVYRATPARLDVVYEHRTLHIDTETGHVVDEGQKPRFILRVANWLHLNRGKRAWTYMADAYAAALLFLSISGLFMIPGRKGLLGRGGILLLIGLAVPLVYVQLSGGPEHANGSRATPGPGPGPR